VAVADDILDVTASTEALGKTAGKDQNMDKATYPKLLGLEGSRLEARRLVREAKQVGPWDEGCSYVPYMDMPCFVREAKQVGPWDEGCSYVPYMDMPCFVREAKQVPAACHVYRGRGVFGYTIHVDVLPGPRGQAGPC
jgi:hypothetical protein